jgi:hypothetical protein
MFYPCLRIEPIFVVFSNCKKQANLMDFADCGMRNAECGMFRHNGAASLGRSEIRNDLPPTSSAALLQPPTSSLPAARCQLGIALC